MDCPSACEEAAHPKPPPTCASGAIPAGQSGTASGSAPHSTSTRVQSHPTLRSWRWDCTQERGSSPPPLTASRSTAASSIADQPRLHNRWSRPAPGSCPHTSVSTPLCPSGAACPRPRQGRGHRRAILRGHLHGPTGTPTAGGCCGRAPLRRQMEFSRRVSDFGISHIVAALALEATYGLGREIRRTRGDAVRRERVGTSRRK